MSSLAELQIKLENQVNEMQGKLKVLKYILDLRVGETDANGDTKLHLLFKNLEVNGTIVKQLLDTGADANARNYLGKTPLYYALASNKNCELSIIELLVDGGANLRNLDVYGQNPLLYALSNEVCPVEVIKFFIEKGSDIHKRNVEGLGVFDIVLENNNKPFEIIKVLIEKGADIYAVNKFGSSSLHTACRQNQKDVVKFLLRQPKIKVNLSNKNRWTPLHMALEHPNIDPEIIKILLKAGANVLKKNKRDEQALHVAAIFCNPVVIRLLLDYGARVNVLDKEHHSPLYFTVNYCDSFNRAATKILLDAGALIFEDYPIKKLYPRNGWPFDTMSCLFDAARIYVAEKFSPKPSADIVEQRMEQVQLLLKYALLENPRLDFQKFRVDEITRQTLIDFGEQCLQELKTVCAEPNVTLAQYILRARLREEEESITEDILEIISASAYPLYKEIVLGLVSRDELKEVFQQHSMYTVSEENPEECEVLDFDTMCCVMMYLEDDDLLNTLLAVYNPKKVFVPSIRSLSDQAYLDEIEAESGRFFKRARIN